MATAGRTFGTGEFGTATFGWFHAIREDIVLGEDLSGVIFSGYCASVTEPLGLTESSLTTASVTLAAAAVYGSVTEVLELNESGSASTPATNVFGQAIFGQSTFGTFGAADITKTICASLTLTESLNHDWGNYISETLELSDELNHEWGASISDSFTLTETINHDWQRNIVEVVSLNEAVNHDWQRSITEALNLNDSIFTGRFLRETLSLSESIIHDWQRSISESLGFAEAFNYDWQKNISESLGLNEQFRLNTEHRLSEALGIQETPAHAFLTYLSYSLTESLGLNDTIWEGLSLAEAMTFGETLIPATPVYINHANLVALWSMNQATGENAIDEVEGITLCAYSTYTGPRQCGGGTILFDAGRGECYLNTASLSAVDFSGNATFTVCGRYRQEAALSGTETFQVIRFLNRYGLYGFGNNQRFIIWASSAITISASNSSHSTAEWQSLAGSKSTSAISLWINGVNRAELTGAYTMSTSSITHRLGNTPLAFDRDFQLDYVAIFNTTLGIDEIGWIAHYGILPIGSQSETLSLTEKNLAAYLSTAGLPKATTDSTGFGHRIHADYGTGSIDPPYTRREALSFDHTLYYWTTGFAAQALSFSESFSYLCKDDRLEQQVSMDESLSYSITLEGARQCATITLSESISWNISEAYLSESLGLDDSFDKLRTYIRSISDPLGLNESLDFFIPGFSRNTMMMNETLNYQLPVVEEYIHARSS